MRSRGGDGDIEHLADEFGRTGEIHYAVIAAAAAEFARMLSCGTLDQHVLRAAYHGPADGARLRLYLRLEARQAFLLQRLRGVVGEFGRRCARSRTVEKGVGVVKTDLGHEFHGRFEIALGLAGEADDEVR